MHLFYAPELKNNFHELSPEESKHCIKVLRLSSGDIVHLTDGRGTLYQTHIIDANPRKCRVEIDSSQVAPQNRPFYLHLAVAPTKNLKRFEWLVEKVTEIGVDEITPIRCFHSERKTLNTQRLQRIMVAAMKQSLKTRLPLLHDMQPFSGVTGKQTQAEKYMAHLENNAPLHLQDAYSAGRDVLILIGPEGDFSQEEIEQARSRGFKTVILGKSRLRTETAGIAACYGINWLNGC